MTVPWIIFAYVTWMVGFVSFYAWIRLKDDRAEVLRNSASAVDKLDLSGSDNKNNRRG